MSSETGNHLEYSAGKCVMYRSWCFFYLGLVLLQCLVFSSAVIRLEEQLNNLDAAWISLLALLAKMPTLLLWDRCIHSHWLHQFRRTTLKRSIQQCHHIPSAVCCLFPHQCSTSATLSALPSEVGSVCASTVQGSRQLWRTLFLLWRRVQWQYRAVLHKSYTTLLPLALPLHQLFGQIEWPSCSL